MGKYLTKRLLIAVPVLLLISMATFFLNQFAEVDPVRKLLPEPLEKVADEQTRLESYCRDAASLGFDQPLFYFSIRTAAHPDTFHRLLEPSRREWLDGLLAQSGNWQAVQNFSDKQLKINRSVESLPDSVFDLPKIRQHLAGLRHEIWLENLEEKTDSMAGEIFSKNSNSTAAAAVRADLENLQQTISILKTEKKTSLLWLPAVRWHGSKNQYHRWLAGFFTGNLGKSFINGTPVGAEIGRRVGRTAFVVAVATVLAFGLGVPLGLFAARRVGHPADIWLGRVLMAIHSMPIFWLGGLLILAFATEGFGWKIFGIGTPTEDMNLPTGAWISANFKNLVLPILTLTLHALATLALQMRGSAVGVASENFVRTARAKGLSEGKIYWRHIFRNALFPVITLLAGIFPAVFAGSLMVEVVFNLPGMGMNLYDSFFNQDFPMLMAITMIVAALTIFGQLVADVLYVFADPRVRYASM